ncbi:hypothetical protein CRG98_011432 [Punica granatum]|uniref:Uncharacterized protein n=1 Tax=Punica granatum TaxID=22663 RepID=A0A2I0KIW9_PUNGR|nr:hypothetical protein CRG98_011432 [Punica granatum]
MGLQWERGGEFGQGVRVHGMRTSSFSGCSTHFCQSEIEDEAFKLLCGASMKARLLGKWFQYGMVGFLCRSSPESGTGLVAPSRRSRCSINGELTTLSMTGRSPQYQSKIFQRALPRRLPWRAPQS